MTEIRTTSATGGQKGMKEERHDLLPREGIEAIARVFGFGATKYADHNWRRGYDWSKSYAALQRHLVAFWAGETYDEESGLPHLAHAGFHVLVLLTWLEVDGEGSQYDDRYLPELTEPEIEGDAPPMRWITGSIMNCQVMPHFTVGGDGVVTQNVNRIGVELNDAVNRRGLRI